MTLSAAFLFRSIVFAGIFVTAACGGSDSRAPDSTDVLAEEQSVTDPVAGIDVSMEVPATVAAGENISMKLTVTNTTAAPIDLYLGGRDITFDIVVTDSSGSQVWQRLEDEVVQSILQLRTLAAGEKIEMSDEWNQRTRRGRPVGPGVYTVQGSVITDGTSLLVSDGATVRIVDR
jgi:hypothetical protein